MTNFSTLNRAWLLTSPECWVRARYWHPTLTLFWSHLCELQCFRGPKRCLWSWGLTCVAHNTHAKCYWWLSWGVKSCENVAMKCFVLSAVGFASAARWRWCLRNGAQPTRRLQRFFIVVDRGWFYSFLHQIFCVAPQKVLFPVCWQVGISPVDIPPFPPYSNRVKHTSLGLFSHSHRKEGACSQQTATACRRRDTSY